MLLCTVRECHQPLRREERRFVCACGHAFDIARSGYVNLLQPNERRSRNPGDSAEAVAARRRLHDRGLLEPILLAVRTMASGDDVLDVGCGDGYWLCGGQALLPVPRSHKEDRQECLSSTKHGIDIS